MIMQTDDRESSIVNGSKLIKIAAIHNQLFYAKL